MLTLTASFISHKKTYVAPVEYFKENTSLNPKSKSRFSFKGMLYHETIMIQSDFPRWLAIKWTLRIVLLLNLRAYYHLVPWVWRIRARPSLFHFHCSQYSGSNLRHKIHTSPEKWINQKGTFREIPTSCPSRVWPSNIFSYRFVAVASYMFGSHRRIHPQRLLILNHQHMLFSHAKVPLLDLGQDSKGIVAFGKSCLLI